LAGGEGFSAMRGGHFHPKRRFFGFDHANPVNQPHGLNRPAPSHFIDEQVDLMLSHAVKHLVFQSVDGCAAFRSAHHAEETDHRPDAARNRALPQQRRFVNRLSRDYHVPLHAFNGRLAVGD
jgi:hypothetical protein